MRATGNAAPRGGPEYSKIYQEVRASIDGGLALTSVAVGMGTLPAVTVDRGRRTDHRREPDERCGRQTCPCCKTLSAGPGPRRGLTRGAQSRHLGPDERLNSGSKQSTPPACQLENYSGELGGQFFHTIRAGPVSGRR